jgi:hypothetical protein
VRFAATKRAADAVLFVWQKSLCRSALVRDREVAGQCFGRLSRTSAFLQKKAERAEIEATKKGRVSGPSS